MGILILSLFLAGCSVWSLNAQDRNTLARSALRSGEYGKAREIFEAILSSEPDHEDSLVGLLRTLRETGFYQEARQIGETYLSNHVMAGAPFHLELGRIYRALGDYNGAERAFRQAVSLDQLNDSTAVREIAVLFEDVLGRSAEAVRLWEQLIDEYRSGTVHGSRSLGDVAVAAWRRGYINDARDIFIDATSGDAAGEVSLESLTNFGYLFLEKYNAPDAIGVFRECLDINPSYPPALVGMALAKKYESNSQASNFAGEALKVNPNYIPALNLLAELRFQEENLDGALLEIDRALSINGSDLETLSLKAVHSYLAGNNDDLTAVTERILSINPSFGRLYSILAENMVMRRKYKEAVDFNRKAVELSPRLWPAYSSLGINLMRIGQLAEGRRMIERAFEGDPYNVWAYNTLDLLDQIDRFVSSESEHFYFLMAKEDEPILAGYASQLAEEVYNRLTKRYGFTPEGPIQIELFPDSGGFSVRTVGLPELRALGVCFGNVIAMNSPRAMRPGEFNWGTTLWHEFTHVITLQMTNHNIPRWFSEGLSVYEERRARPGWGDDLSAAVVKAYQDGRLLKVSELNAGMMRPKFPEQVALSYYQASLFCELIDQRFGFEKIRKSLNLFAENQSTDEVFRQVLGWDMDRLDEEYGRFVDERLHRVANRLKFEQDAPDVAAAGRRPDKAALQIRLQRDQDDFFANLQLGTILRQEKANREAEACLKKAQSLFPEYVGPGNPYEILGDLYYEDHRDEEALAQYEGWSRYNENALLPLIRAAEIYRKRQDLANAMRKLELAIYIDPYNREIHEMLGETAMELPNWDAAVTAYKILLGLDPDDPAGTHFQLARAWLGKGELREAKRSTLRALEIAPMYEPAQELLLKLNRGQSNDPESNN